MSQLTCLTVRGFKSIRALEDFELRPLNVLIGANGAGKSNFLALFYMLSRMAHKCLWRFVSEQGGPDAVLFGGMAQTRQAEARFVFGQSTYRFTLVPQGDRIILGEEETGRLENGGITTHLLGNSRPESVLWDEGENGADSYAPYVREAIAGWRAYHFHDTSVTAGVRNARELRDNLELHPDASNLVSILWLLRKQYPDHYRHIIRTVRLAAPFFGDFLYPDGEPERVELRWFHVDDPATPFGLHQLSDGTLRFICLSVLLLLPDRLAPKLILLDEPELGLHPVAITLLAGMFRRASETRQVVVSTQSADLVSEMDPKDIVVARHDSDGSVFERPDLDSLREWLEDDDCTLGDLWKMNVFGGRPGRWSK